MSKNLLFGYDTETTGFPLWKEQSSVPEQPHLVQVAAQLIDDNTNNVIQSIDLIIKPEGWEVGQEALDIHGITTEMAHDLGVPERVAVDAFISLWDMGKARRVAFNKTFDQRILRIALMRYGFADNVIEQWANKDDHDCAMQMARKIMPGKSPPKLVDAYKYFTGHEMEGAHNALADTEACMTVYWAAKAKLELNN